MSINLRRLGTLTLSDRVRIGLSVTFIAVFVSAAALLLLIPRFAGVQDLKITRAFEEMKTLEVALERYRVRRGDYPDGASGLAALTAEDLVGVPHDPWGNDYVYRHSAKAPNYLLYSVGENGRDENGGGDDVTTPEKRYRCEDYAFKCPADRLARWIVLAILPLGVFSFVATTVTWSFWLVRRLRSHLKQA